MNATQTTLKVALLLTVLTMFTACGMQTATQSNNDFASRTVVDSTAAAAAKNIAYCNQKAQGGLTAKLMVYVDATNKIRNDYMKVKIMQIPASFASGDYIEFFRWQATAAGQIYLDPVPTQARFETLDGRIITNFSPVIYWSQVSAIAAQNGMSDVNTFFQNVRLVVDIRDPQASYDVLKIAMYNSSNTNTINMDMLLPSFFASPTDYALDGGQPRANALQALHPFVGITNWSAAQYLTTANTYCF